MALGIEAVRGMARMRIDKLGAAEPHYRTARRPTTVSREDKGAKRRSDNKRTPTNVDTVFLISRVRGGGT